MDRICQESQHLRHSNYRIQRRQRGFSVTFLICSDKVVTSGTHAGLVLVTVGFCNMTLLCVPYPCCCHDYDVTVDGNDCIHVCDQACGLCSNSDHVFRMRIYPLDTLTTAGIANKTLQSTKQPLKNSRQEKKTSNNNDNRDNLSLTCRKNYLTKCRLSAQCSASRLNIASKSREMRRQSTANIVSCDVSI